MLRKATRARLLYTERGPPASCYLLAESSASFMLRSASAFESSKVISSGPSSSLDVSIKLKPSVLGSISVVFVAEAAFPRCPFAMCRLSATTTRTITGSANGTADRTREAMHRLLLVLLAAAGASVLGLPRLDASPAAAPCLAPQQWEGRWVTFDHSTGRNSRASVSYDGLKQRIRVLQQNKKHAPCQR
ncbi:Mammalian ependymin-related protein 1 [Liparis tanakae]|uniref:Mammalian ependymin-related protein 1 n=1 Tax=Liparis tanakae TaxID=230148 RepID=A0A4Z2FEB7_9TELE|nr:Mammalian ependymin-related protein 1 [Liparis tanakae]